jgi:hypothetical protein
LYEQPLTIAAVSGNSTFGSPGLATVVKSPGEQGGEQMQTRQLKTTEGAIWGRVIRPAQDGLTAEAARAFLGFTFDRADRQRMHELAEKAREGTLTPEEKEEVAAYERVGSVLSLLKAKARRCLKNGGAA